MYRVFIKEKIVFFTSEKNIRIVEQPAVYVYYEEIKNYKSLIQKFSKEDNFNFMVILCNTPKDSFNSFLSEFKHIPAAGGLILNENNEILLIFRKGHWDLPKGKINRKETSFDAAIREVKEETGLQNIKSEKILTTSWHLYQLKNEWVVKPTDWYQMRFNGNEIPVPETEEEITEIKWFDKHGINEIQTNTYPLIKSLLDEYYSGEQ